MSLYFIGLSICHSVNGEIENVSALFESDHVAYKSAYPVRGVGILIWPDLICVIVLVPLVQSVTELLDQFYVSLFHGCSSCNAMGIRIQKGNP